METTVSRELMGTEFNPFLRTQLWEEREGGRLSLLSALARLGLDPWGEAADLARLPRPAAAARLADLLGRLPGSAPEDEREIACQKSVSLLPLDRHAAIATNRLGRPPRLPMMMLAVWIGVLLTMTWLDGRAPSSGEAHGPSARSKSSATASR
jgi:hypothetical protein